MNTVVGKKIESFFAKHKHNFYKKGEVFIRASYDPTGVFYLQSGYVKQYIISKKGDEIIVNIFKPPSFFPMSWAINNTSNSYFFEATTPIDVWRAPREEVVTFIKNNPDVLYDLTSRVYTGTDALLTRMVYLMSGSAYLRLIAELIISAKRFGKKGAHNSYTIKISEKDIGCESGMTRETVSREIKILKNKNLVTLKKNILIIHDFGDLENELLREK